MKRYIIVCGGEDCFTRYYRYREGDIFVACDGGIEFLRKRKFVPYCFCGDRDSVGNLSLGEETEAFFFPPEKDKSDFELTLERIFATRESEDYEVIVYNATGKRLDHFLAALKTIIAFGKENIKIIDSHNLIYLFSGTGKIVKKGYRYISFFALSDDTVINLEGFKYNLDHYRLTVSDRLCLSNEILSEGKVSVNRRLLVIESDDRSGGKIWE